MTVSSLRTLASELDKLVEGGVFVHEGADTIIVSELSAKAARQVSRSLAAAAWHGLIFDGAGTETALDDITDDFGPYRISAQKPVRQEGEVLLLTASGFHDWLVGSRYAKTVMVVGLETEIATEETKFLPAEAESFSFDVIPLRSPRMLVREYGAERIVPHSIGRWLLSDPKTWHDDDLRFRLWAEHAFRAILPSLSNEIDQNTGAYIFKGPPRLTLSKPEAVVNICIDLGRQGFGDLQAAARWVYELEREVETRHTLLATEIARTGSQADTIKCVKENIGFALEGAKIVYQMSLAKVSADNLKALADLRKAVTDETAKITDATRQVVTAVASALAIGIGLITARVVANAPSPLIVAVMTIVCAYIFVVIYSGHKFAALQRDLRDMWRNQLYRFLSEDDYGKMVVKPGRDADHVLRVVSCVGGGAVALTFFVAIIVAFDPARDAISPKLEQAPAVTAPAKGAEPTQTPKDATKATAPAEQSPTQPKLPRVLPAEETEKPSGPDQTGK